MLREIGWFFVKTNLCHFCQQPLTERHGLTFGHRRHGPVTDRVVFHHKNKDRSDNRPWLNVVPAHPVCHRRFHAQERANESSRK